MITQKSNLSVVSRHFTYLILLAVFLTAISGCDRRSNSESNANTNVIKDYVNTPKNKALDVKDKVESAQQKEFEQAIEENDEDAKRE